MTTPKRADVERVDVEQAADILRQLLAQIDRGELEAPGRRGAAIVARIESAVLGLETATDAAR